MTNRITKVFYKFLLNLNPLGTITFAYQSLTKRYEDTVYRNYQPSMFFKTNIGISNNFIKTLKVRIWGSADLVPNPQNCQNGQKGGGGQKWDTQREKHVSCPPKANVICKMAS